MRENKQSTSNQPFEKMSNMENIYVEAVSMLGMCGRAANMKTIPT
jgi:hypothetical protein